MSKASVRGKGDKMGPYRITHGEDGISFRPTALWGKLYYLL